MYEQLYIYIYIYIYMNHIYISPGENHAKVLKLIQKAMEDPAKEQGGVELCYDIRWR